MNSISNLLVEWYEKNKRDLPWRGASDPYLVWISEVILQQTRVATGIEYYERFVTRFPTAVSLAEAREEDVLSLWKGLGYYSRARNLHSAAQTIVNEHGGKFPTEYANVRKLKGIGEYTAAAICSLAYKQPFAAVDGNVIRVLSRLFGIETAIQSASAKNDFNEIAYKILNTDAPDVHNQAIMEFGALLCVPKSPKCEICPLRLQCYAYENQCVDKLPNRAKAVQQRTRNFNYFFTKFDDSFLFSLRKEKDIWQNLYEFPMIETPEMREPDEFLQSDLWRNFVSDRFNCLEINKIKITKISKVYVHKLTHQRIFARFYEIHLFSEFCTNFATDFRVVSFDEWKQLPVPKLIENYLKEALESLSD